MCLNFIWNVILLQVWSRITSVSKFRTLHGQHKSQETDYRCPQLTKQVYNSNNVPIIPCVLFLRIIKRRTIPLKCVAKAFLPKRRQIDLNVALRPPFFFFCSESVNTFLKYPAKMLVPVSSNNKPQIPFVSNPENLMVPNSKYKHFSAPGWRQPENV